MPVLTSLERTQILEELYEILAKEDLGIVADAADIPRHRLNDTGSPETAIYSLLDLAGRQGLQPTLRVLEAARARTPEQPLPHINSAIRKLKIEASLPAPYPGIGASFPPPPTPPQQVRPHTPPQQQKTPDPRPQPREGDSPPQGNKARLFRMVMGCFVLICILMVVWLSTQSQVEETLARTAMAQASSLSAPTSTPSLDALGTGLPLRPDVTPTPLEVSSNAAPPSPPFISSFEVPGFWTKFQPPVTGGIKIFLKKDASGLLSQKVEPAESDGWLAEVPGSGGAIDAQRSLGDCWGAESVGPVKEIACLLKPPADRSLNKSWWITGWINDQNIAQNQSYEPPPHSKDIEEAGSPSDECIDGYIFIQKGTFVRSDGLVLTVNSFCLGRTEVTVSDYEKCVRDRACSAPDTGPNCTYRAAGSEDYPVNCVDWTQAQEFAKWKGGRLPTETEWEFAARGRRERKFPWGDVPEANCDHAVMSQNGEAGCSRHHPWPVCSKLQGNTPEGICDMAGNVWEWTANEFQPEPQMSTRKNSRRSKKRTEEPHRAIRGGSWADGATWQTTIGRTPQDPGIRGTLIGFRVLIPTLKSRP